MVNSEVIYNPTSATVQSTITLEHHQTKTQTTHWEHHFGVGLRTTWKAETNFIVAKAEMSVELSVSYDYKTGLLTKLTHCI